MHGGFSEGSTGGSVGSAGNGGHVGGGGYVGIGGNVGNTKVGSGP